LKVSFGVDFYVAVYKLTENPNVATISGAKQRGLALSDRALPVGTLSKKQLYADAPPGRPAAISSGVRPVSGDETFTCAPRPIRNRTFDTSGTPKSALWPPTRRRVQDRRRDR